MRRLSWRLPIRHLHRSIATRPPVENLKANESNVPFASEQGEMEDILIMRLKRLHGITAACAFAPLLGLPTVTEAQTVSNPSTSPGCMANTANFNPTLPPGIALPPGFTASVFASGLNMPTGIAFLGSSSGFQVLVLESGHGLPSVCNDETLWPGSVFT
jgi:hypothetical protein